MQTHSNDQNKARVLAQLDEVRAALAVEPPGDLVRQALTQCERLQVSILQFHAEGLRFAAFTLLRLTQPPATTFGAPVQQASQRLKAMLDEAGYPH
jgi:hypothetical protein